MFPLALLNKSEQVGNVGVLRLSLPFATNATDTSGNAIPTYTAQGTPTYSSGYLLLDK